MRALAILAIVSLTASADGRFERFCRNRSDRGLLCDDYAFFEFAPVSGAGMPVACSGPNPTGARGEILTFTRASTATCTKTLANGGGLATTGIANGDLVSAPSGSPRPEYDANGVLGLLIEQSRTNSFIQSQSSDNVVWQKLSSGVTAPVVTADTAVAPDGTTTADTVAFPAVSVAANYSDILQNVTLSATSWTYSEYVKGVSGSGRLYVMCTPDGATYFRSACDYVATSWTRCSATGTATALGWYCGLGVDLRDGSQATQAAQSVYRWGTDGEAGAYATSYIPTTTVAVTRAAETAGWTLSSGVGPNGCIAVSATFPSAATGNTDLLSLGGVGAGNNWAFYRQGDTVAGYQIGATLSAPVVSAMGVTTHRWVLADNAGTRTAFFDAVSKTAPAASLSGAQTALAFSNIVGFGQGSTIYSRVQVDPSSTRCSP